MFIIIIFLITRASTGNQIEHTLISMRDFKKLFSVLVVPHLHNTI